MTPTAWEFRNKLLAVLSAARYSGQHYVDVDSSNIHKELGGDPNSTERMPICHEIMTKLMRPGDSILKEALDGERPNMVIRYILKNKQNN